MSEELTKVKQQKEWADKVATITADKNRELRDEIASLRARPQEPGDLNCDNFINVTCARCNEPIGHLSAPSGPLSDEPRCPHVDWSGDLSGDGPFECELCSGDEPRELEWDELEKGYISAGPFIIEQCIAGERRFISLGMDYPFPGEDWDAAKSLAEKLNAILDGRPLWTEGDEPNWKNEKVHRWE